LSIAVAGFSANALARIRVSVFRVPLAKLFGWSIRSHADLYHQHLCAGIAAFFGGLWLNRKAKIVALTGGSCTAPAFFWRAFRSQTVVAVSQLWCDRRNWTGFSYIVPSQSWSNGFRTAESITGIAVGGSEPERCNGAVHAAYPECGILPTFAYPVSHFLS